MKAFGVQSTTNASFLKERVTLYGTTPNYQVLAHTNIFVRFSTRNHSNVTTEREVLMCEICQALLFADVIR